MALSNDSVAAAEQPRLAERHPRQPEPRIPAWRAPRCPMPKNAGRRPRPKQAPPQRRQPASRVPPRRTDPPHPHSKRGRFSDSSRHRPGTLRTIAHAPGRGYRNLYHHQPVSVPGSHPVPVIDRNLQSWLLPPNIKQCEKCLPGKPLESASFPGSLHFAQVAPGRHENAVAIL